MASATTPNRVEQIVEKWYKDFELPFSNTFTEQDFFRSYDPQVEWYDHAFHVRRVGHDAVLGLRKSFLHCNDPFRSEAKAIIPTADGAVVELIWIGNCRNDIVRPNGEVAVKASGRDFTHHGCFILKINEEGRIWRIDEYYNRRWDEGVAESEYHIMK